MGTNTNKSYVKVVMHLLFALSLASFATGCAKSRNVLTAPGVVQTESPGPNPDMPEDGGDVSTDPPVPVEPEGIDSPEIVKANSAFDASYKTLRVRVFPILSVPAQDPYPVTGDTAYVSLYNSRGLKVFDAVTWLEVGVYNKIEMDAKAFTLTFDGKPETLKKVYIQPVDATITTTVKYDDAAVKVEYRGDFMLRRTLHEITNRATGTVLSSSVLWSVVNYVGVDDYLLSVVPSEMPSYFHVEALKAQAVAARTYALFHAWIARNSNKRSWDVDPTTWYQSYRGALVENTKNISPAVVATAGMVLIHSGKIIEAFFSANSGGTLCSVSECFGLADRAYIVSKPDIDGVRLKPAGTWNTQATPLGVDLRLKKMQNEGKLTINNLIPGYVGSQDIAALEPYDVGAAGRIARLALRLTNGSQVVLDAATSKEMRWQFGMKTAYYEIAQPSNGTQAIVGYGLGHGVGMSQWGARIFADQGSTYDQILKFYYEGVTIETL